MSSFGIARVVPHPRGSAEMGAWLLALATGAAWLAVLSGTTRGQGGSSGWLAGLAGLAAELAFTAGEAVVAGTIWSALGARVRWAALAPRLLVASGPETLAVGIASGRAQPSGSLGVWLAGPRAAGAGSASGLAFAFASAGILTLARIALSAHLQAGVARSSFARSLAVVAGMWLVTRLVLWWVFDLLQGRSFQS